MHLSTVSNGRFILTLNLSTRLIRGVEMLAISASPYLAALLDDQLEYEMSLCSASLSDDHIGYDLCLSTWLLCWTINLDTISPLLVDINFANSLVNQLCHRRRHEIHIIFSFIRW